MIGELAALGCAFTWALTSILVKQPVVKMGAVAVNTIRTWVGALVFIAILLATGRASALFELTAYSVFALTFSIAVGLGIGDTLYFRSLQMIGVARALPISGSYPLPTLLLAVIWLGEPITWLNALGTVLIVAAVYLISRPMGSVQDESANPTDLTRGVLLAVLAGLTWAGSTALLKSGVGEIDVVVANSVRLPAAGLFLLAIALRRRDGLRLARVGPRVIAVVVFSGVVGTALGSGLYLTAVVYAGAAKAAALQSVSPFFAAPLALAFLGERITRATAAGTLLSVLGVWLLIAG